MTGGVAVRDCDALIIVPPFEGLDRPSLAAHLLQACARRAGHDVAVLYANVLLAARIGEAAYQTIAYSSTGALIGERYFCAAAYDGVPLFGREAEECEAFLRASRLQRNRERAAVGREELTRLAAEAGAFADEIADAIAACAIPVVGATSTFEQTAASYAILRRVKQRRPATRTILGGANCEGEMGEGLRATLDQVDVIFSGECEAAFPAWLDRLRRGEDDGLRLITGPPCADLDGLPLPDYSEYYEQIRRLLPESAAVAKMWLPYESSRGCWWGEKHHCTFCGLNAQTMAHREKSPDRVVAELQTLLRDHPTRLICMVDNIMPFRYFQSFVPRLSTALPDVHMFYEQKANLSLAQVSALVRAGIREIQPGIEALATPILRKMDKGVTARQNVALMRYARSAGLAINWNLIYALPGDDAGDYRQTLEVVRRITHLQPPSGLSHLSIDRFSPYFDAPERYGIRSVRPMPAYRSVLPESADAERIAYHFVGEYATGVDAAPDVIDELARAVADWIDLWQQPDETAPWLGVELLADGVYMLVDTRRLPGTEEVQFLDEEEARVVLAGVPAARAAEVAWAIERHLLLEMDGWLTPLATADPQLLAAIEHEALGRRMPPPGQPMVRIAAGQPTGL